MSLTPAEWRQIQQLVKQQVSIILSGNTAATQVDDVPGTESIDNLFPGCPTVEGRPLAHPYGLVSRAPKGTAQVTARQGEHPANRIVLLHRDKNRPQLDAEGDVWLYDSHGNQVKLIEGKIVMKLDDKLELGEGATKEAARKGDAVQITGGPTGTDPAFITFIAAVCTAINALAPGTFPPPIYPLTSVTGQITGGSSKVTITD